MGLCPKPVLEPRSIAGLFFPAGGYTSRMAAYSEQIARSRTRITKLVFPQDTNPIGTLYGGTALKWMDEVAFLTATRFARCQVVTVSMDRVDFKVPIPQGSIVELVGEVTRVGDTSVTVRVQILLESSRSGTQNLAIEGHLAMVAVDEAMDPMPVVRDGVH